ncbi:hypothetical protein VJY32_00220 [Ignavibacteria bacterium 4148-Me]
MTEKNNGGSPQNNRKKYNCHSDSPKARKNLNNNIVFKILRHPPFGGIPQNDKEKNNGGLLRTTEEK